MKHGEVPWFLMWGSALLFTFGMVWAWLAGIGAAMAVTVLEVPMRSALLVGTGVLGTIVGQFGMLRIWRRYVRTTEDNAEPVVRSTARSAKAAGDDSSDRVATEGRA